MLRKVLNKVEDGRFGRALAGMQAGWQWDCKERHEGWVAGQYGFKAAAAALMINRLLLQPEIVPVAGCFYRRIPARVSWV